jgi:hypothetical protein
LLETEGAVADVDSAVKFLKRYTFVELTSLSSFHLLHSTMISFIIPKMMTNRTGINDANGLFVDIDGMN